MTISTQNLQMYDAKAAHYDIFAEMMEKMLNRARGIFRSLHGQILEVGTGTGQNLKYYAPTSQVIAMDWSPNMVQQAKRKIRSLHLQQIRDVRVGDVQRLDEDFPPASFDFVTSTCVFCSVPNPILGLRQIKRVLRPTGYLVQLEHGTGSNPIVNALLRFFDRIVYRFAGTHISRSHEDQLKAAGFTLVKKRVLDPFGVVKILLAKPRGIRVPPKNF